MGWSILCIYAHSSIALGLQIDWSSIFWETPILISKVDLQIFTPTRSGRVFAWFQILASMSYHYGSLPGILTDCIASDPPVMPLWSWKLLWRWEEEWGGVGESVGEGTGNRRGLWVGSLHGLLVAQVLFGPAGSLYLRWRMSYGDKEREYIEDSVGSGYREWRRLIGWQPTWSSGRCGLWVSRVHLPEGTEKYRRLLGRWPSWSSDRHW